MIRVIPASRRRYNVLSGDVNSFNLAILPGWSAWRGPAFFPDKPEGNPVAAARGPQKMAVVFFPDLINELKEELLPADRFPYIEIDPEVPGGAPVIKGTRIATRAVASIRESGENPKEAYPDLNDRQIANAEAYEEFLRSMG
jgi:uncharacterized protein (DUF433 family)